MHHEICNDFILPGIMDERLNHSRKQSRTHLEIMRTSNVGAD
jgi:hypothetical protein